MANDGAQSFTKRDLLILGANPDGRIIAAIRCCLLLTSIAEPAIAGEGTALRHQEIIQPGTFRNLISGKRRLLAIGKWSHQYPA
jgi:hypothetical protein